MYFIRVHVNVKISACTSMLNLNVIFCNGHAIC